MTDPLVAYWNAAFETALALPEQAEDGSIEHRLTQQELYDMRPFMLERMERMEREWEQEESV